MASKNEAIARMLLESIDAQFQKNIIDDGFDIGVIKSINPLIIEIDGFPLYEKDLYINKYLLAWDEQVNIETSVNGDPSHSHTVSVIHHPTKLQTGYFVTLYGLEWDTDGKTYQKYCLLNVIS